MKRKFLIIIKWDTNNTFNKRDYRYMKTNLRMPQQIYIYINNQLP